MTDITKAEFTTKDLENLREQVNKMAIKPLKFLGREYYIFIAPRGTKVPHQSLHNRIANIWFNILKRRKSPIFEKNKVSLM